MKSETSRAVSFLICIMWFVMAGVRLYLDNEGIIGSSSAMLQISLNAAIVVLPLQAAGVNLIVTQVLKSPDSELFWMLPDQARLKALLLLAKPMIMVSIIGYFALLFSLQLLVLSNSDIAYWRTFLLILPVIIGIVLASAVGVTVALVYPNVLMPLLTALFVWYMIISPNVISQYISAFYIGYPASLMNTTPTYSAVITNILLLVGLLFLFLSYIAFSVGRRLFSGVLFLAVLVIGGGLTQISPPVGEWSRPLPDNALTCTFVQSTSVEICVTAEQSRTLEQVMQLVSIHIENTEKLSEFAIGTRLSPAKNRKHDIQIPVYTGADDEFRFKVSQSLATQILECNGSVSNKDIVDDIPDADLYFDVLATIFGQKIDLGNGSTIFLKPVDELKERIKGFHEKHCNLQ